MEDFDEFLGQDSFEIAVFMRDNEGIKEHADLLLEMMRATSAAVEYHSGYDDSVTTVCYNSLMRSSFEFERLVNWQFEPIEMVAWSARNLFELNLQLHYALLDRLKMERWFAQMYRDEIELLEGIRGLDIGRRAAFYLDSKIIPLHERLTKQFPATTKMPNMSDIARAVSRGDEYTAFYKLYSKYVHPTSWLLNEAKVDDDSRLHLGIFLIKGYRHAEDTGELVRRLISDSTHWSVVKDED